MIANVTYDKLAEKHGKEEGFRRFKEIAELGGFGTPTRDHTGGVDPNYRGGLDLKGLQDSKRITEAKLAKIQELAGGEPPAKEDSTKKVAKEK
jgi:hypothetical protein